MSALTAALLQKIENRSARAGVVGLGYVGLPLAVELAKAGFRTTGIDLDQRKISAIAEGHSYIPDVDAADVKRLRAEGKLDATADFSVVKELDMRERLIAQGSEPFTGSPDDLRTHLAREIQIWGKVVREAGIKVD